MGKNAPVDDETKAAILAEIKAGGTCRGIARDYSVAPSTVSKIAKEAAVPDAFERERSQTEKGTRAARFDAKAARQQLIEDLYGDAQRLRERAWSPYTQVIMGPVGAEFVTTKLPPIRDQQAAFTAIAIAIDKATKLEGVDSDGGAAAGKVMVNELRVAFGLAHAAILAEETEQEIDLTAGLNTPPAQPGPVSGE